MRPMDPAETFRESLERCLEAPDFLLNFYGLFMASSDEVRKKFEKTDFARQTCVLADSLWTMAVAAESRTDSPAWGDLPRLAELHSRSQLDIGSELYDQWLDCLLEAARRHDPLFTPETEAAWRETLAVGIALMRSRY
jgi:hypothetical protein